MLAPVAAEFAKSVDDEISGPGVEWGSRGRFPRGRRARVVVGVDDGVDKVVHDDVKIDKFDVFDTTLPSLPRRCSCLPSSGREVERERERAEKKREREWERAKKTFLSLSHAFRLRLIRPGTRVQLKIFFATESRKSREKKKPEPPKAETKPTTATMLKTSRS